MGQVLTLKLIVVLFKHYVSFYFLLISLLTIRVGDEDCSPFDGLLRNCFLLDFVFQCSGRL